MKGISEFVEKQLQKRQIEEDDKEIYRYGYKLLLEKMIAFLMTLTIMIISGSYLEILFFCFAFIPIRSYAGGYHSRRACQCFFLSSAVVIIFVWSKQYISVLYNHSIYTLLTDLVICIVIFFIAPIETKGKITSVKEKKYYHRILGVILCTEIAVELYFHYRSISIGLYPFAYAHFVVLISLIIYDVQKIMEERIKRRMI